MVSTVQPGPIANPVFDRPRLKDRYWFKTLKWHLYKRRFGAPSWTTSYVFDRYVRSLTARDTVIDCGANLGEYTRKLAMNGAAVHAFEPDPYTFSRLCEHTADLPNVTCHNAAVGVGAAKVKLYRTADFDEKPDAASISSSLFADKLNVATNNFVEVDQIDLASFVTDLGRHVRVLKMDIEGAEVPLLEHMIAVDALDCFDIVVAETHEDRIPALAERTAHLRRIAERDFPGKLLLDWH